MTYPSFSVGEVLTASDMNAVSLWRITSATIPSAVSSVTVSNVFSSTYDNYLITVNGGTASTDTVLGLRLGAKTTDYRYQYVYGEWANTPLAAGTTTGDRFQFAGSMSTTGLYMHCVVMSPNLTKPTRVVADGSTIGAYSGNLTGFDALGTSYTAFTILTAGGTISGGTITVYGYGKA